MREFSTERERSAGLLLSMRDEIHSFEDVGLRRLDGDADDTARDDARSLGVRGREKRELGSGEDGERLESEGYSLSGWGDWPMGGRFI
jgi:hypothetical protein